MQIRLCVSSVILLAACGNPTTSDLLSNVGPCALGEVASVCDAVPQPITSANDEASAPLVDAGVTYAISAPGTGERSFVVFVAETTGTHTLYFGGQVPLRVCDLEPTCAAEIDHCASFHRAAQFEMVAGERYEIELGPIAPAHPAMLHVLAPAAPPPPPPPGGQRIVFAATLDGQAATDLYTMAADGSDLVRVTDTPGGELYPSWSPDRTRIAFVRDFQLFAIDAGGGNELLVAERAGRQRAINGNVYSTTIGPAAWSPDGTRLAYPYPRDPRIIDMDGDLVDESYATMIHLVDADGTGDAPLANDPGFTINSIAWSPDGTTLLFSQADDCPDCAGGGFYGVIQSDGTEYRQLVGQNGTGPSKQLDWSSDGTRWVYVGGLDYFSYEAPNLMFTSSAFGTDSVQLVPDPGWNTRWSPDDTQVAYIGADGIYVVAADGTGARRILAATNLHGIDW